jgi:predicted NBD/HSP70 family sugar kinase
MHYDGIGVSLPGRVDSVSERIVFAPNLKWHDKDLKIRLEKATGLPVEMENEACACALSEFWFGDHAENERNLIAVAVSEGIGTGVVIHGQLFRGSSGFAGEFGHVPLSEDGPMCSCGNRGCWEVYASNRAAIRYYHDELTARRRQSKGQVNGKSEVTFSDLIRSAEQGDPSSISAINKMGHYLGLGISMLVTGLSPDVVVVVGEISAAWAQVEPIITKIVVSRSLAAAKTRIITAGPAPRPRLRGIIALVLQKHFGAPSIA